MNKIAIFILPLFFILPAYGQEDKNIIYKVAVGEFGYSSQQHGKPSVGDVLIAVADAMSSGNTHSNQLPQYAGAVRASIVSGISCSWRLNATEDGLSQDEIESKLNDLMPTEKDAKYSPLNHTMEVNVSDESVRKHCLDFSAPLYGPFCHICEQPASARRLL